MEERRRARRMRLESTITVRRIDSGIDEEVTIEIKDISKSGIGFFCTEILEVGSIYQSSIIIWTKEIIPVLLKIVREVERKSFMVQNLWDCRKSICSVLRCMKNWKDRK